MSSKSLSPVWVLAVALATVLAFAPLWAGAQGTASPISVRKIVVSPANHEASVGEIVNFQIIITNITVERKIIQLYLQDSYSSLQMEFVSATPPPDFVDPMQSFLSWTDLTQTMGDLLPGQSFIISLNFRAIAPTTVAAAVNYATAGGVDDSQMQFTHPTVQASLAILDQCPPDPFEPNDDVKNAKQLALGQPIRAYICPASDKDLFNLSLPEAGTYFVRLYNLPDDFQLLVRDASGGIAGISENMGTMPEEVKIVAPGAGRYVVEVYGNDAFSRTRTYELMAFQPTMGDSFMGDGSVMPMGRLVLSGMGLPTGLPAVQRRMMFYLNMPGMDTFLGETPVLPGGRFQAAIQIPDGIMGQNAIIGRLMEEDTLVDEIRSNIQVHLLPGYFSLWVDDAWKQNPNYTMPVVNKIIPLNNNIWGLTQVDVVTQFQALGYSGGNVKLRIKVSDNRFGSPNKVFVRNGFNGTETNLAFTALGGGQYEATIPTPGTIDEVHVVFRFGIPSTLSSQTVNITAAALNPSDNSVLREITQARKVRLRKGYDSVVFLIRNTLFRDFDDAQVADLLGELHIHSADWNAFGVHDRPAPIYYVDRYRTENSLRNWNNMTVDYSSESNANQTARFIWFFMQEAMLNFTTTQPFYIMIVGNDEQFPFYRYKDPVSDEDGWLATGGNNPAMIVTRNDMYFTDNYYAYFLGGTVSGTWQDGNLDLTIGRIIGDGAEDMKNFYLRGMMRNGGTNRAVMASVDGWELGYEPDDNRAGEIKDYLNVPGRLNARGFATRNDNETPRTVDVMDPYPSNWNSGFVSAANGGADLFFIGGHNDYRDAGIPGDNFDPGDIPSKYTRFDDDNPITMIVGCHGGLPVPVAGTWPGGANNSMVYGVIRDGARAYYGASGYSYGSPGNLHKCLWGELLLQHNFGVFTQNSSYSSSVGFAVRQGKINYPFGVGSNNGLDKKTVTEFNLFGVPWQRWAYPGGGGGGAASMAASLAARTKAGEMPAGMARERALLLAPRPTVKSLGFDTYQQTFHNTVGPRTVGDMEGFDVIEIPGGEQQYIHGAPVLPALTPFSIALPTSGTIISVAVENLTTQTLGTYNIPTALIAAWSVSGITLTADTTINAIWPPQIAEMAEAGERHFLLKAFPIRHNPTTDETILHEEFDVVVTYEAPVPFGVLNFAAVEDVVGAGVTPAFTADVFNMGAAEVTLGGDVTIYDKDTSAVMDVKSLAIVLPAGSVYPLASSASAPLPAGQYEAHLALDDGLGNAVVAQDFFEVADAQLANLTAAFDVGTGLASFSVDAKSFLDNSATLEIAFAVSKADEEPLGVVTTTPATLDAGATLAIPGTWAPNGSAANMTCLVEAVGALDGKPLNSVKASFAIFTPEGLLDALINHILERELMSSTELQTADLNQDGAIDSADVILAVDMLPVAMEK